MTDLNALQANLKLGMKVRLFENGEAVAGGTITNFLPGEVEFTDGDPQYNGFKGEFAYKQEWGGWRKLHDDPFTGARCTSELGAIYFFEPIEQTVEVKPSV